MDSLSNRVQAVTPSVTLAVTNQAKALRAQGEEVYGLAGGEPDMDTPDHIKEAAIKALQDGKTKYTPAAGLPELREGIAKKLLDDNQIEVESKGVCVTSGGKQACYNAILAVVEEGDEVIIPSPYWVSYPEMVRLAGGVPVMIETTAENGWKITPEQFEAAMTPATKMIILNSPGNPTGTMYTPEELAALGEVASYEDIIIMSDEIYEKLIYGDKKHVSIASISEELAQLTVVVGGFSKAYSMTGWRLGYTATANAAIAQALSKIQGHTSSNATTFAQYGALAALEGPQDFIEDMKQEYDVRRQFVAGRLKSIPNVSFVEPEGAFYYFVDCTDMGLKSQNLCDKLLNRYKVAMVPGIAFGHDASVRLSYCTTLDVIAEGLSRFEEFCDSH
ncbi:pyridoxal phosphate-dependent aminotransferase [Roseibacillus ishigakijimensis]|uniref:Aminotransferase n=1 Tax=Roseibacillus ishigakijimensis TaxID=454146 RepID=A0A934RPT8_9BACT|nr:pyridoxal phosphate-dependent aminotransferase [Roseibacillus ishigakijimensis]MBK1833366.1 pyridoxal phosphate-dependent aminotransferase [Roseibacillus ishigakijimensis]